MSLLRALSGEIYRMRVMPPGQLPVINWLMAQRNAARVLPLPVGAVASRCPPDAISRQAID